MEKYKDLVLVLKIIFLKIIGSAFFTSHNWWSQPFIGTSLTIVVQSDRYAVLGGGAYAETSLSLRACSAATEPGPRRHWGSV